MTKASLESTHVPRSREVRLGVVMYGGISLAVYINGVANELFRASRGRGVYRLLKALTDSHVVVDILSGASAGGINSILLSTALCNETEFNDTGKLWRDEADMAQLLKPQPPEVLTHSVLSGAYHQDRMEAAFKELLDLTPPKNSQPEDPSPVDELDLFITGTDIGGRFSHRLDALRHRIQLEDHRALFQLKHRNRRKQPFAPDALQLGDRNQPKDKDPERHSDRALPRINKEALATLAHLTSCFPGAFVPLHVNVPTRANVEHPGDPGGDVHGRLSYWGQLEGERKGGKAGPRQGLFMDGGVLRNKPFTSTIEAIFSRLADTQVSRFILYIEPDPQEAVDERAAAKPPKHLPKDAASQLGSVAFEAASGLPRFESIDADLQSIETHNAQVRRYETLVRAATEAAMLDPAPPGQQAEVSASSVYGLARLGSLAQLVQDAVSEYLAPENALPGAALTGLRQLHPKAGLNGTWDVLFGFRRLIQLTYSVDDAASVPEPAAHGQLVWFSVPARPAAELPLEFLVERALLTTLNRQIEVYEIVRARIERGVADLARDTPSLDLSSADSWAAIEQRALDVLGKLPWPACFRTDPLPALEDCLSEEELKALRRDSVVAPTDGAAFLKAAQSFEQRLLSSSKTGAPLLEMYERFQRIDEVAFPLQLVSQLRGRDQIQTVRISPFDATRAFAGRFKSTPERVINKLCGVQLFNFGAFFKCSWRSNDLLWGRIDGVTQLLDILLDPPRLDRMTQPLLRQNLEAAFGHPLVMEDLALIFPHSSHERLQPLLRWLHALAYGNKAQAVAQLRHGEELREAWAYAAQLEVLADELPQVFKHAESELQPGTEAHSALCAQRQKLFFASPQLTGAAINEYFWPDQYTLGEQTLLADLPTAKLLGFADQGGAHLRAALENSLPDDGIRDRCLRDVVGTVLRGLQLGGLAYLRWRASKAKKPRD